jgi:hypothetical protein
MLDGQHRSRRRPLRDEAYLLHGLRLAGPREHVTNLSDRAPVPSIWHSGLEPIHLCRASSQSNRRGFFSRRGGHSQSMSAKSSSSQFRAQHPARLAHQGGADAAEGPRFDRIPAVLPVAVSLALWAPRLAPRGTDTPSTRAPPAPGIWSGTACSWPSSAGPHSSAPQGT